MNLYCMILDHYIVDYWVELEIMVIGKSFCGLY